MGNFSLIYQQYKLYIIIAAIVALVVGEFFFVRDIYVTKMELTISKINLESERVKGENLQTIIKKNEEIASIKSELEKQNVKSKEEIDKINSDHLAYVRKYGLRDPGKPAVSNPVPKDPGSTCYSTGPRDDSRLSDSSSEFILTLTHEANKLRIDYKTCMDWMDQVKRLMNNTK